MKVLEVSWSWPTEVFISRHILALSTVSELELSVAVRSPAKPSSASIQSTNEISVPILQLPNFDHMNFAQKLLCGVKGITATLSRNRNQRRLREKALLHFVKKNRPDIIHFHFGRLAVDFSWAAQELSIPYTISTRGSDIQVFTLIDAEYKSALKQTLSRASGIHTVCELFSQKVKNLCDTNVQPTTIRTCVPVLKEFVSPRFKRDEYHFITVGRLHWCKGFDDLIRAISYLSDARLNIIGDGPDREYLTYLVKSLHLQNRVKILGKLPYYKVREYVQNSDAYVQTSIAEGFSNSLAEAMALGKPVFATPVGGTTEVLKDQNNGIIIPVGEPQQQAERLRLVANSQLMERIAKEAQKTSQIEFSEERHAQNFFNFFKNSLENKWC